MEQKKNENKMEISVEKAVFKVGLLILELDLYREQVIQFEEKIKLLNNTITKLADKTKNKKDS